MKLRWFTPWGWIFRPIAPAGYLLVAIAILFLLQIIAVFYQASHSLANIFYAGFPYLISTLTVLNWVASKTSTLKN